MKRVVLCVGVGLLWMNMAWAGAGEMDPLTVGVGMYKLHYENDRVRVMEVTFEPGAKIGMHSHPDHAVYFIEGGQLKVTLADGQVAMLDAPTGQASWLPAQSHAGENTGKTRIRILVTELKEPAPAPMAADPKAEKK